MITALHCISLLLFATLTPNVTDGMSTPVVTFGPKNQPKKGCGNGCKEGKPTNDSNDSYPLIALWI